MSKVQSIFPSQAFEVVYSARRDREVQLLVERHNFGESIGESLNIKIQVSAAGPERKKVS